MKPLAACLLVVVCTTSCTSKPILYPNQHYKDVGQETAERDIEDCSQMAKAYKQFVQRCLKERGYGPFGWE